MSPSSAPGATESSAGARSASLSWALCMAAFALLVYALANNGGFMFFDYHVWLADAFLHGRLDLVNLPPWLTEVAHVNGRTYVFFGPIPAVLLMPLVAIAHTNLNLARVCNVMGAIDVALVWLLLDRLRCSRPVVAALTIVFAFGSVTFWEATYGNTWLWAQLCAVFFLLTAALEVLGRRRAWMVGLLLGCAALSRESCALAFPFYALLVNHPRFDWKRSLQLVSGIGVLAVFDGWYNWARFGSPLDNGYLHANQTIWHPAYGSFSWHYILPELFAYFWRGPTFVGHPPYVMLTDSGLALLWTTPAFVYLAGAAYRMTRETSLAAIWADEAKAVALAAWSALLPMAGLYLVYFWDGWRQFGCRYSLDYEVFVVILLALYLRDRVTWKFKALALASVVVNLWGVLYWRLTNM